MAIKKRSTRYNPKTYKVYGEYPFGNHRIQVAMSNDRGLYEFVSRNNKRLANMPKDTVIKVIKSRATASWTKKDLRDVNSRNVRSKDLKHYLRNFNN